MPEPTFSRPLTKTGQPVLGSTIELDTTDGGRLTVEVVGKLFGPGGAGNLIGIIVEDREEPARATLEWPLTRTTKGEEDGEAVEV